MSNRTVPGKLLARALEIEGYLPVRTKGVHTVFTSDQGGNPVVVRTSGDVPLMHVRQVLEATGIPRQRFFAALVRAKSEPRRRYTLLSTIFAKPTAPAAPAQVATVVRETDSRKK